MGTIGENVRRLREAAGMSQDDLATAAKTTQSTIDRIEREEVANSRFLPRIAGALRVSLAELDETYSNLPDNPQRPALAPVADGYGPRDFQVYSAAEGGAGEIYRSADPIDWWPRPIEVLQVKGAYGMYVVGESMVPEFKPGHVAVVNPNLPHIAGKAYIFYGETEPGQVRATLKELRRHTEDHWYVRQHNPPPGQKQDFSLSRKIWREAHRIVGRQDPS
jgi:transcriptional regulator with XRE-family HTH domain